MNAPASDMHAAASELAQSIERLLAAAHRSILASIEEQCDSMLAHAIPRGEGEHVREQPGEQAPLLVTSRDAARLLSISQRLLYSLTTPRGTIPAVRIGGALRYAVSDLDAFIESRKAADKEGS